MATASRDKKWVAREELREKGQFWTPQWVARPMVRYAMSASGKVFDPAVGAGAFARALRSLQPDLPLSSTFSGCEIDPAALHQASDNELSSQELVSVVVKDFLEVTSIPADSGVVANPPYIRHHRMSLSDKVRFQELAIDSIGQKIDGRAGIHVFFLLHSLKLLGADQKLSFIVPADVAEGVFSTSIWSWILSRFRLEAVARFEHKATPFPGVDTNPLVFFIRNAPPVDTYTLATCSAAEVDDLDRWVIAGLPSNGFPELSLRIARIDGAEVRGVGRDDVLDSDQFVPLSCFATTLRGIATGANEFFFMTKSEIKERKLPMSYFVRAVGRTRDVRDEVIDSRHLEELDEKGAPTYLLSVPDRPKNALPVALEEYLASGEALGLHQRALISQRKPWFKMETRRPPAFLFAYLGRRNIRFIRNDCGVVPLTGFLCVYPKISSPEFISGLWNILQDPRTIEQLSRVGKSYGGGAIKVEPKALARLPIPRKVVSEHGMARWLESVDLE